MTQKKSQPTASKASNVKPLHPIRNEVDPPEGWVLKSVHGYMGRDATPDGRLVRLHDVVDWLAEARGIPMGHACKLVEAEINAPLKESLFHLRDGDYALPFNGREDFCPFIDLSNTPAEGSWLESMKLWMSGYSGPKSYGSACFDVAILLTKACELWGYGRAAPQQAEAIAGNDCHDDWTGNRLATRQAELKADGKGKHTQRLVAESGVGEREIRRRIAEAKGSGALGSIAHQLGGTVAKGRR